MEYITETFQREENSLADYMTAVRNGLVNRGAMDAVSGLQDVAEPEYESVGAPDDTGIDEVAVDPQHAYVQVVEDGRADEYVLAAADDDAIGVISEMGGHIIYGDGEVETFAVSNEPDPLVQHDVDRSSVFYRLMEQWEAIQDAEKTGRAFIDPEADDDSIRIRGNNEGVLESKYGDLLDRLAATGEAAIDRCTHLGGEGPRGNDILQDIRGVVRRMDDDRGIDPMDIERHYDENTPRLTYEPDE